MDKRQAFLDLAARLRHETQAADWAALARTDRQLAGLLASLPADLRLNAAEQAAYHALRLAHEAARSACAQAQAQAHERLQALCDQRMGWAAYALSNEMQEASA